MTVVKKFTEEEQQIIVDMYSLKKHSVPQIIKECGFKISREMIYRILKTHGISLVRKTGVKHDLIGKSFGYLTVVKMAQTEKSKKKRMWRAICTCSNCGNDYFDVNPQSLLRGQTTSCGCRRDQYHKLTGVNSVQYKGCGELNGRYWGTIKARAERRGYNIGLTIEYAWDLYLKQDRKCALSGLPIDFAISNRKSSETSASLDRIDCSKGYVEGNVQWVHKHVNIMKNVYEQEYFIYLCNLISKQNGKN